MVPDNIKTVLYQTQNLMYGFNYEVTLGLELFERCFSLRDINNSIKATFPDSTPDAISPILISPDDFWKDINEKFDYRGDNIGVSLELNENQEQKLKAKQNEIKNFLLEYLNESTQIYSYQFLEGIPGYPVFWEYTFALLNRDGICVFFYGSSSD